MNARGISVALSGSGSALAILLYVAMWGVYAAHDASAMSVFGLTNLLNDTVVLALAASGLTLVVLSGELDLSGAGVIAICNTVVATVSTGAAGAFGSLAAVCLVGLVVGLANGVLVAIGGLQSLAVTIGTMIVCQGVALLVLNAPGGTVADPIANGLTADLGGLIPVSAIILLLVCGLWTMAARTRTGVAILAVGADATAAELSGLNVRRARLVAFAAAGVFYALAGFMLSAETGTGDPRVSNAFTLFMFASVAIGGTALTGGRGSLVGSIAGAGILTVMQKMLFALGVASFYTNVFDGVIMLCAILFGNASAALSTALRRRVAP